jgi:3-deoxy-D-manno-octulosonate 8-phosphate phosphatase (KDO 8-P phosphatase)
MMNGNELKERAKRVRLVLMDCDGVLTDGRIVLTPDGEEIKFFHSHDGQGLKLAAEAGLRTGIITVRQTRVLERRAKEVSVKHLWQKSETKLEAYRAILAEEGVKDDEVAYIGDDLPDIPVMRRVGLAIAVANAVAEVRSVAHLITDRPGGHGGVREAIEFILKAQGRWEEIISRFISC